MSCKALKRKYGRQMVDVADFRRKGRRALADAGRPRGISGADRGRGESGSTSTGKRRREELSKARQEIAEPLGEED